MKVRSVALVGPYPPPAGGVAVHIERLAMELQRRGPVCVIDPYSGKSSSPLVRACGPPGLKSLLRMTACLRHSSANLFHFHVSAMQRFIWAGNLLAAILPSSVPRILTVHSGSFVADFAAAGWFPKKLIKRVCGQFDGIIAVNEEIAGLIRSLGVAESDIAVIPAYMPPALPAAGPLTDKLRELASGRKAILVMSGYGLPLYGYDVVLKAIAGSGRLSQDCFLVICLYNEYDPVYIQELEHLSLGLPGVLILRDLTSAGFLQILGMADIYVRATQWDGDAVAIREAGHLGMQVIASDGAVRPPGTLLFPVGDVEGFAAVLKEALRHPETGLLIDTGSESLGAILEFYDRYSTLAGRVPQT